MKGIILTGGAGTRLRPLTHTGPKQLIPIANKPNVLYCLEDLRDAEITDIGVILGDNQPGKVRELLGDGSKWGSTSRTSFRAHRKESPMRSFARSRLPATTRSASTWATTSSRVESEAWSTSSRRKATMPR